MSTKPNLFLIQIKNFITLVGLQYTTFFYVRKGKLDPVLRKRALSGSKNVSKKRQEVRFLGSLRIFKLLSDVHAQKIGDWGRY